MQIARTALEAKPGIPRNPHLHQADCSGDVQPVLIAKTHFTRKM